MKKILIATFAVVILLGAILQLEARYQPQNLGWVNIAISSGTQSEIDNSTATDVGRLKYCTNCAANGGSGTICVSTQTTGFHGFVLSTGTICK